MNNVFDYIKQYADNHDIKNYFLKSKAIDKAHAAGRVQFSGGVAFFYKIFAEGDIAQVSDLSKKFLQVETPTDFWDLSPVVEVTDYNTLQKVSTDIILIADNTINFNLYEGTADSMFQTIYNFCAQYIYLLPLGQNQTGNDNGNQNSLTVKVDY